MRGSLAAVMSLVWSTSDSFTSVARTLTFWRTRTMSSPVPIGNVSVVVGIVQVPVARYAADHGQSAFRVKGGLDAGQPEAEAPPE
ncbi:MAG: hypothetical protein U1E60_09040 [Reyranellaceae bacterium]